MTSTGSLKETLISKTYHEETEVIYENKFISLRLVPSRWGGYVSIQSGSGKGAVIVVVNRNDVIPKILLVRQPRFALTKDSSLEHGYNVWELPRGGSNPHETLSNTAQRELYEETNLAPEKFSFTSLGSAYVDTGIVNTEVDYFYVETHKSPAEYTVKFNDDEANAFAWVPLPDLIEAINNNEIKDSFTIIGISKSKFANLL